MTESSLQNKLVSYLGERTDEDNINNENVIDIELDEGEKFLNVREECEKNSQNRILVEDLNQAFETVEKSQDDQYFMHFIINKSFKRFESENFEKLTEVLQDKQVTAFQCASDGTFCITWKKTEKEIYAINISERNNIDKEDLMSVCSYILEFLNKCLQSNHSGLSSDNKTSADKFNIALPSLDDSNGLNLLFHAASNGNTKIIPILLQIAFNVNMVHDRHFAGSLAYSNGHYETVLVLLKNNAAFPAGFNVENCQNEDLKAFAKMTEEFHDHIMASNLEEIRKNLSENPKLLYFHNIKNQSASAVALKNKKFEVYELLLQNNIYLSIWENIEKQTKNLNEEEKLKLREIHFNNKKDIHEPHLFALLQKCSVGHDDDKVQERLNHVLLAFQELNKFPLIQILLKIAALLPNLQIIFDFNRDSVEYMDPTQDRSTFGLFCTNGRIYVGAKQIFNSAREHEVFATIAHELCHFVLFSVFGNMAKPYKDGDEKTETEFQTCSSNCRKKKEIDEIVKAVYDYYPPRMFHAELIVRIPHFYAHYCHQPEVIENLKVEFKSLFDFYEFNLMPKLEKNLKVLKKKAENMQSARDKKIISIALIIGLIAITCVGLWISEPFYQWSELNNDQKMKVFNGSLRFERVDAKFYEIYGKNDTTNEVFDKLTSDQIKTLLNEKTLDLNEDQNEFLQKEIFLIYQNMSDTFKATARNSSINFQGEPVVISSLLESETEKILESLNSTQIVDLIKDKKSIKIGQEIKNSTKFHIERKFLEIFFDEDESEDDNNDENQSEDKIEDENENKDDNNDEENVDEDEDEDEDSAKLSSDLIKKSENKKVILLSDDAGTGKSTTFKHLALELKQKYPQKWLQYVDLKSKIKIYRKYQNNDDNWKEILIEIFGLKDLSLEVFKMIFDNQTVVILWDGFDEISPTYSNFMLKLMKNIKDQTQNIQFISTRPHCEKSIKKFLNCPTYKLEPLTKDKNEEFLNKFFDSKDLTTREIEKAKDKVQNLIIKAQENAEDGPEDYVESPLMLEIFAEVSLNDDDILNATNLYTIYDSFINAKLKLTDDKGEIVKSEKNKNLRTGLNLDEVLQYFAVKSFENMDKMGIVRKYDNKTHDIDLLSRNGILIFDSDGDAQFIHSTFAEFFLAQYFVDSVNSETDCDDINERFKAIIRLIIHEKELKVQEFMTNYVEKEKTGKVDQNLLFCFENNSELNNLFLKVFHIDIYIDDGTDYHPDFDRITEILEIFPFTSKSLEILWHIDRNKTFFNDIAESEPEIFVDNFDEIKGILTKYFPNDKKKQKKLLFGLNQRGSHLYVIYKNMNNELFNEDDFLKFLKLSFDFDLTELESVSTIYEFYEFVKLHLTEEEIREMIKTHFVDILVEDGLKMWKKIETEFAKIHEELQELIYTSKLKGQPLLYYIKNFNVLKLIFKTLEGTPDSRFVEFIQDGKNVLVRRDLMLSDDNFEYIWNVILSKTTKDERKKILNLTLIEEDSEYSTVYNYNILSASIEFGTVEKFEFVKSVYQQHFESTEKMREIYENYFQIESHEIYPLHPKVKTAEGFFEYLKSLFTIDEIKSKFKELLEKIYKFYSNRDYLDNSYPYLSLLEELYTVEEYEILRLSQMFIKQPNSNFYFDIDEFLTLFTLPPEVDRNDLKKISTYFEFYMLIKPHLKDEENREYLKTNFILIVTVGGLNMWNEIKLKFTRDELQKLIYESNFRSLNLLYFPKDFDVIQLILETLDGKPDSRFVEFIQKDYELLFIDELIMTNDNFVVFWNVILNQTTENERKNLLELNLLDNIVATRYFNIYSASVEFGTVEIFELVKKIYEQHSVSDERIQFFCTEYFKTRRYEEDPWHPKVETAEAFVNHLQSLFETDEIRSQFKESLENLFELYSARENLDYSYPFFRLLKEL